MAGEQLNQFKKGHLVSNSKNPYQDPTYLTFTIMFDTMSPLFNKDVAVAALKEQYKEEARATKLESFTKTILMINKDMPWYWKSITGVERAFDYDFTKPYRGGDDAVLTIDCNESINLAITGLMDMYTQAVYNLEGWTQVLPENYKSFDMHVIVSEVREIRNKVKTANNIEKDINTDITADSKPMFMFTFGRCKFVTDSAKETFETLNSSAPENPGPKIRIKYETIKRTSATYLNGVSTAEIPDGPGVGTETASPTFAQRTADALNDAQATVLGGIKNFNPVEKLTRPNNVYGSVFDQAFERVVNELDDAAGQAGNIPDNLFTGAGSFLNRETKGLIVSAKENIFGLNGGESLGAALRQGAINSIGNIFGNNGSGK